MNAFSFVDKSRKGPQAAASEYCALCCDLFRNALTEYCEHRKNKKKPRGVVKITVDHFIEAAAEGNYHLMLDMLEDEDMPFGPNDVGEEGQTATFTAILKSMQLRNTGENDDQIVKQLAQPRLLSLQTRNKRHAWLSDQTRHDMTLRILLQR